MNEVATMNGGLSANVTVKELLDGYPELIEVFVDLNLKCVGCPTERFHTLREVAEIYELDLAYFIHQLSKRLQLNDE